MATSLTYTRSLFLNPPKNIWRANFVTKINTQIPCISSKLEYLSSIFKDPLKKQRQSSTNLSTNEFFSKTRKIISFVESGHLEDALNLFDKMPKRDTFVWNVIIRGLVDLGLYEVAISYYHKMQFDGVSADYLTYPFVIKACSWLMLIDEGEKIHGRLIKSGLSKDVYVCNSMIAMYWKFGFVEESERLFELMVNKDLVSWNSMISGYVSVGDGCNALMHFRDLQAFRMVPDTYSVVSALGACSIEKFLRSGKEIHCHALKVELENDVMVQTALVDMYSKCQELQYAERSFRCIAQRSVGAWNAMIGGYVFNQCPVESFDCLREMQGDDKLTPDVITAINLLPACTQTGALQQGKSVHGFAIRSGFLPHVVLETALIDMYNKCGRLNLSKLIFNQMTLKSAVSWNVMVAASVQNDCYTEALELFQGFLNAGWRPDAVTIASILPAYAELASSREGKQIHGCVIKTDLTSNTCISNAIVYMYAKCGELTIARKFFDRLVMKDVVSWNTIIMAYALHSFGTDAIEMFHNMLVENIQPNGSTFVSLLSACSNSGMVDEGWKYFNLMKEKYDIDPGIEHYGCMVDILGRRGNLDLMVRFIEEMPLPPTSRIWGALLYASRNCRNIEIAEYAAHHILSLDHNNSGCYILLSNLYAELRRQQDVERINLIMEKEGIVRTTGCSIIEIGGKINRFDNLDRTHKESNKIYDSMAVIWSRIEENIYIQTSPKFCPLELAKRRSSSSTFHSVRLALVYGLISTTIGKPVLIRKNIRLCIECHTAAKRVSQITKREIIVGDSKIFHHFKDGKCSCGDYW